MPLTEGRGVTVIKPCTSSKLTLQCHRGKLLPAASTRADDDESKLWQVHSCTSVQKPTNHHDAASAADGGD